jgi:hypothetical protein
LLDGALGGSLEIRRASFVNVTTAANNVTSKGVGMYPDPLPFPNETLIFPAGGGTVAPTTTAAFWLTLLIPDDAAAGTVDLTLTVVGTTVVRYPVRLKVWDFAIPPSVGNIADHPHQLYRPTLAITCAPRSCAASFCLLASPRAMQLHCFHRAIRIDTVISVWDALAFPSARTEPTWHR